MRSMKSKINKTSMVTLILISVIMLFPFFWLVRSAFMSDREIMSMPIKWIPERMRYENYGLVFERAPFLRYFLNSILLVAVNVIAQVVSSSFIAYGFARFRFKGKNFLFGVMLSTMMIPYTVVMIPQFMMWQMIGMYNTYIPLMLPAFFGSAFNMFLVNQFYRGIPKAYDEAALVDGANYLKIYFKVIIPMSKPVLCSVGVFTFMSTWNDFLGPLLYLEDEKLKTVSLGLQTFIGQYTGSWNLLMAASSLAIIPMVFIFFFAQRYFIEGITFSGLKG